MTNRKFGEKALAILFMCCFFLIFGTAAQAEAVRIAIFPFQIHSAEDLDFMQAGIYEMLANRLGSLDGTIRVVSQEETAGHIVAGAASSLKHKSILARTLQADYFVSGSLTALGANISTDMQFFSTDQMTPLVKLSRTGSQEDVIVYLDEFAALITRKVFKTGENAGKAIDGLSMVAPKRSEIGRWQSQTFKTQLKGVAVGDIDGNGANEIVVIDKNRVYVFRYENERLGEIATVEHRRNSLFLGVDLADVNLNNKAEIFISGHGKISERPESFVYEHKNGSLFKIGNRTGWYYRVLNDHKGLPMLIAQKKLTERTFVKKFHVMGFADEKYISVDTVTPPNVCTIYNMAFTKNTPNGKHLFVGYNGYGEITAWSDEGQILWESGEPFGGSLNYIEYTIRQAQETVRKYIAKRIVLADTDGNGKQEVIAIRNINSSPAWMTSARRYKHGYIACLEWDASGALQAKWKTERERGYISDIAVGDATNDGKVDLVFTVVSDVKRKLAKSRSYVMIQQLP